MGDSTRQAIVVGLASLLLVNHHRTSFRGPAQASKDEYAAHNDKTRQAISQQLQLNIVKLCPLSHGTDPQHTRDASFPLTEVCIHVSVLDENSQTHV